MTLLGLVGTLPDWIVIWSTANAVALTGSSNTSRSFAAVLATLDERGYDGGVGCACEPSTRASEEGRKERRGFGGKRKGAKEVREGRGRALPSVARGARAARAGGRWRGASGAGPSAGGEGPATRGFESLVET